MLDASAHMTCPVGDREVVICPACGSAKYVEIGEAIAGFDSPAGGRMFRQPAFSIRACNDCGLYFKSHTLPLEQLDDYYANLEFETFEYDGNFPTDRILRRELCRLPPGSRILDFGCNTGRILKGIAAQYECFGVELNASAALIAQSRGMKIVSEEEVHSGAHGEFDAIVLADVFEHLPKPVKLLEALVAALKPKGVLALVTGNADAVRYRDRMAEFWYFSMPGHLLMTGEQNVQWLGGRLGIRLSELHRCSHYDMTIAQRAKQHLQSYAYHQFRRNPLGLISAALRTIPVINRAEHWPKAPSLTCTADHFVALFEKV